MSEGSDGGPRREGAPALIGERSSVFKDGLTVEKTGGRRCGSQRSLLLAEFLLAS